MRGALVSVAVAASVVAVSCGGSPERAHPGGTVSRDGAVGSLRLGVSTRADIVDAFGRPAATATGRVDVAFPRYEALGYDCGAAKSRGWSVGGSSCRTVYFVDLERGVIGSFWTSSASFRTARGTRVGMLAATAARREHSQHIAGCFDGIEVRGRATNIFLDVRGDQVATRHHRTVALGGRVADIAIDGRGGGVGILDC